MMNLFSTLSEDVHFIEICGMSRIGKTTLAYVIYNTICHQFEASSFICDVRETVEKDKHGLVNLQEQLLFETLMEKVNIWNHREGSKVIKNRLCNKKVLIVLDDVNKDEQLKALAGSPSWFGLESRIIITNKDKHLLKRHHLGTTIHKVNGLDNDEALELFSWTVFKQPYPSNEFENLSNGYVKYAKGLPIALKVLGSSLIDKPRKLWEDYLHQFKEIPEGEILDKLEISYKGLKDVEQNLFLDIACFFKGEDKNRVQHKEGFGSYKDMKTLKDKFLITILGGKLRMHDLIQEMGWRIVSRESPQEPLDDLIFIGNNPRMFEETIVCEFEMTNIRLMYYYLGIEVKHMDDGIFISQEGYDAKEILMKFAMSDCEPIITLVECGVKFSKHDDGE
ncbi:disease resistance protein Roq1-like [Quercus suber]|uniref:disease resistance protein Roq1-like n=1 Tax=Quercus suber TaxID=58331 RepID=UPI0032DE3D71